MPRGPTCDGADSHQLVPPTSPDAQRAFFARFFDRIPRVWAASTHWERHDPRGPLATRLAEDWTPILQQDAPPAAIQSAFFARLSERTSSAVHADLTQAFTAEEVAEAIRSCPSGKAGGPNGLPSDWYRDHEELLVPILTRPFTHWLATATLPLSFREAVVFCFPKVAAPRTGLEYRPIALLNTAYKLFSRLLLTRLKSSLPGLVSPAQFGFVPGRQVHDAIDIWAAVQLRVAQGALPNTTTMIMLDFAKVYDTLDRDSLRRALQWHRLPADFVAAVDALHLGTTAAFLGMGSDRNRSRSTTASGATSGLDLQ